ncbi:hypothetical protein BB931_05035 [Spiribacter salinus]|nr:hypothetical protein [Spiribacter salinus]
MVEDFGGSAIIAFFSFFGYFFDIFVAKVSDYSVVAGGTGYISESINVGPGYGANVLYPDWAPFYAAFGFLGIIFYMAWNLFLLELLRFYKMKLTFFYMAAGILSWFSFRHPFLSWEGAYLFLAFLIVDVIWFKSFRIPKASPLDNTQPPDHAS